MAGGSTKAKRRARRNRIGIRIKRVRSQVSRGDSMSNCRSRASAACGALAFLAMLPQVNAAAPTIALSGERRLSFNDGWRFYKGEAAGAEKPEFDDSAWRPVRLPHDWAIEGPFDSTLNPQTGALPMF